MKFHVKEIIQLKMTIRKTGLCFFLLSFISTQVIIAQTTRYVDASKPDNAGVGKRWATAKRDLQVSINGANAGDQVWVKAGSYVPTFDLFGNASPANNRDKGLILKEGVNVYGGFTGNET